MQVAGVPVCPKCARKVDPDWRLCPSCGAPIGAETKTVFSEPSSASLAEEGRFPAGTVLAGRYRVLGLIGQGGMGEVYRAYDLILNQAVALKFLGRANVNESALARFRSEVRIARQVSHPNVCRVYDIGLIEGFHFLSMEYLDGEDLASLIRRIGRLPQDKAIEFTRKICAGLAAAHERGVLHRDLKPANIMIDGRGQVRITDFGLAALEQEVPLGDIRSGTPAYMSPEQKAGKEVTVRSDIYSLGLVLYEMFTGKRRSETHTNPTELVKDLDLAIDRVILRCLEEDPKRRPSSALNVALALPGGDPIAAALAAGETPSPEMVAASAEKEGFQPRTAVASFAAIVVLLAVLMAIGGKASLLGRAPLPLTPDVLAFKGREMLKQFGYTDEPVDTAYGFYLAADQAAFWRYALRNDFADRWARLASHQPALIRFYYRQASDYLVPIAGLSDPEEQSAMGTVTAIGPENPPNTQPGSVRVSLDAEGRLVELRASPSVVSRTQQPGDQRPVDWSALLGAAGLDPARFVADSPQVIPPMYADASKAWVGSYGPDTPYHIRVEAAAFHGRPVFFRIDGPWDERQTAGSRASAIGAIVFPGVFAVLLVGGAIVAGRNVRLGRSDQRGAWRVSVSLFAAVMLAWVLITRHVPAVSEIGLLITGLSQATFVAVAGGLAYLAIEPYVRRNWPEALISWARLVILKIRDPLVSSHILAGAAGGLFGVSVRDTTLLTANQFIIPQIQCLDGIRWLAGLFIDTALPVSAFIALLMVLVLVLLRLLLRRNWLGDVVFCVLVVMLGVQVPQEIPAAFVAAYFLIWLLRRFGLLAFATYVVVFYLGIDMPLAATSWYTGYSLTTPVVITAVCASALYSILASRPSLRSA